MKKKKKLLTILLSVFIIITSFSTRIFADTTELNLTIESITKDNLSSLPKNNITGASPDEVCEASSFVFYLFNESNNIIAYACNILETWKWKNEDDSDYEGTPDFNSVSYVIEEISFTPYDSFAKTMNIKVNGGDLQDLQEIKNLHKGQEGYLVQNDVLYVDVKFQIASYAAEIDGKKYKTLQDAIAAAPDNTETTITMLGDVSYTSFNAEDGISAAVVIPSTKKIVLDLNGNTISGVSDAHAAAYLFHNKGHLTIKDSQEGGKITYKSNGPDGTYGYGTSTILNRGVLTIESGTVENTTTGGASYAVDNQTLWFDDIIPVEFNMNGGNVVCTTGDASIRQGAGCGTVYTKGGEIVKNYVTISGGTVTGDIWIQNLKPKDNTGSYTDLKIEGGTITGKVYPTCADYTNMTVSISGGKINQLGRTDTPFMNGIVTGGLYANEPLDGFIAEGYKIIDNPDDSTKETYPYKVVPITEAQIVRTGTIYASLQAALDEAESGDTIKLLEDIELSSPVRLDKVGTFVIDGNGKTIKPATGANFGADGCLCFGKNGGWDVSEVTQKIYTIKNTTFQEFNIGVNDVIRAEGSTLTIDKCTFKDNIVEDAARSKSVILLTGVDAKVINSTFDHNTAGLCVDFNTQGGSANPNTPSNIKVDNCNFSSNNLTGNGVIYLYGPKGSVTNNTFEGNTITADGAAIIYLSGKADRIANNLFKTNTITADGAGKLGVIAFGSGSAGTALEENAFVGNIIDKNDIATTSGTIYVGANNISVERNYWGNGAAPEKENGKDIYTTKGTTASEYATAYTNKANSYGVNVTIASKIAKNGTNVYTSYDAAKEAATANKFGEGWYFNVDPSADLVDGCKVIASDDSNWLYKVIVKTVDINTKTDVEPSEKEATAPTGRSEEAQVAQEAAQKINDFDKTLGGIKDLQPDAVSKLNDSSVVNTQLETKAKTVLTNNIKYDETSDTLMLVIEPYFDVETITGKKENSKITNITYEIDAKYNILATTASTTEQMIKEGVGKNTVEVETDKDLNVTKPVTLSIPLPDDFDAVNGDTVYVKHTHGSQVYYYDATIVVEGGQKYVTFTNPNGFSTFEIMKEKPAPAPGPSPSSDPKPRYKVPNTGVDGTYSNNHSLLKLSSLSLLTIGAYLVIKKKKDN